MCLTLVGLCNAHQSVINDVHSRTTDITPDASAHAGTTGQEICDFQHHSASLSNEILLAAQCGGFQSSNDGRGSAEPLHATRGSVQHQLNIDPTRDSSVHVLCMQCDVSNIFMYVSGCQCRIVQAAHQTLQAKLLKTTRRPNPTSILYNGRCCDTRTQLDVHSRVLSRVVTSSQHVRSKKYRHHLIRAAVRARP